MADRQGVGSTVRRLRLPVVLAAAVLTLSPVQGSAQVGGVYVDAEGVLLGWDRACRNRGRRHARERRGRGAITQLADVDHHQADVLVGHRGAERRHRRAGPAVLDAGRDLGIAPLAC